MSRDLVLVLLTFVGLTLLGSALSLMLDAIGRRLGLARRTLSVLRGVVFTLLGLVFGVLGLALFFSDGPPLTDRVIVAMIAYPIFGLTTGYFNPRAWMISGLAAWGPVIIGIGFLTSPNQFSLTFVEIAVLPLALALLGGYIGSLLRRRSSS